MPFRKLFRSIFKKKDEPIKVITPPANVGEVQQEPIKKEKKMESVKPWIKSKTIWAILIGISPVLTKILGFDVDATLADITTIIAAATAIYFRIKATNLIK